MRTSSQEIMRFVDHHVRSLQPQEMGDYWTRYMLQDLHRWHQVLRSLPTMKGPVDVLDIGTTPFTWFLASRPDLCVATVDRTTRYQAACEQRGVAFQSCNLEQEALPYADASFDFVVFDAVIEHLIVPPSEVLSEIRRVLRPSGELLVGAPNFARLPNRLRLALGITPLKDPEDQMLRDGCRAHVHEYTLAELRKVVTRCGYRILKAEWVQHSIIELFSSRELARLQGKWLPFCFAGLVMPSLRQMVYVRCTPASRP